MTYNRRYRVFFFLDNSLSPNNLISIHVSICTYTPPFLRFTFKYSHHDTRFFTDEFVVKLYR